MASRARCKRTARASLCFFDETSKIFQFRELVGEFTKSLEIKPCARASHNRPPHYKSTPKSASE